MRAEVVVGANYGDEGKGLFTDFLCRKSSNALVVLTNGGSQRGHTVNTKKYGRFVFHHFGSGTFQNASTYFSSHFLLNPMMWIKESDDLQNIMSKHPACYRSSACRFQLPVDIYLNRVFEEKRGEKRHGSVGSGIFETVKRYRSCSLEVLTFSEFLKLDFASKMQYVEKFNKGYAFSQLTDFAQSEMHMKFSDVIEFANYLLNDTEYAQIFLSKGMTEHFCRDCENFGIRCKELDFVDAANTYETLVFEQGQGLMLDPSIRSPEDVDDTTPSFPGTSEIGKDLGFLLKNKVDISEVNVNYISRTYLTKHGAGKFKEEPEYRFIDLTNKPNPYQGHIRFGKLDYRELFSRTNLDFSRLLSAQSVSSLPISKTFVFTHVNEVDVDSRYKKFIRYQFSTGVSEDL